MVRLQDLQLLTELSPQVCPGKKFNVLWEADHAAAHVCLRPPARPPARSRPLAEHGVAARRTGSGSCGRARWAGSSGGST